MPRIAECREINGQMWVRVPVMGDEGVIQILSQNEIDANAQKMDELLAEIDRLNARLRQIEALINDPLATREDAIRIARAALKARNTPET